jgi:Right handed beta helix region
MVELTARGRIFAPYKRGLGYITVCGFVMEHCANQLPTKFWRSDSPQAGALGCRGGHHWVIENNTIRFAKTVAIDCGSEGAQDADGLGQPEPKNAGHHLIRNNVIAENGAAGIVGFRSTGTKIIGNVIENNASLGLDGSETAGIKVHFFIGGLIERNLIRNNGASGIWLDNVWYDSRVTRNVILNNNGAGLFIEMGVGPLLVDRNIIALNTAMRTLPGDGVYSHDASGVTLAHNLIFFNANFGVWSHLATERNVRARDGSKKLVEASGWRVLNNIIIGNHRGSISLPVTTERSKDNISDYNLIAAAYDWVTSETYGKELEKPIFSYNTNKGRVTLETLRDKFQQALDRAKIPQSARPNLAEWIERPILTLNQWKLIANNDRHSLIPKIIRPDLSVSVPFVKFAIDNSPSKLNCKAIAGIEVDFFGIPIPTGNVNPGPFQLLKFEPALQNRSPTTKYQGPYGDLKVNQNLNTFLLWPIPDRWLD